MAPLGEHFPAELLRPRIEAALKPGCVIKLLVKFPQITKHKYLVLVADDDPEYFTFIVNSEINPFVASKPHLLQCQVSIDAASHDFLDHDSHIACHDVLPMKREEVIKSLMVDPSAIKGEVSPDVRTQIVAAVKFAKTIEKDKKNRIIAALENTL
jgi:alkyl hydroperoxide reductase subunit AhpC